MAEASLGVAVTEAVRLLRVIHLDSAALLATLDNQMAERGWEPLKQHYVGAVAGTMNHPGRWLIDALYRGYVPAPKAEATTKLVTVLVEFEPPPPWNEPLCIVNAVAFAEPKMRSDIWNRWNRASTHRTIVSAGDAVADVDVSKISGGYLAGALWCSAHTVTLCSLQTSASTLREVVEPALSRFYARSPAKT